MEMEDWRAYTDGVLLRIGKTRAEIDEAAMMRRTCWIPFGDGEVLFEKIEGEWMYIGVKEISVQFLNNLF